MLFPLGISQYVSVPNMIAVVDGPQNTIHSFIGRISKKVNVFPQRADVRHSILMQECGALV